MPAHRRGDLDLRRAAARAPTRSRTCSSRTSGSCPGNRVLLRGAEQPVAGGLLVRACSRPAASSSPRCRCCAPGSCTSSIELDPQRRGALRPPVRRRPRDRSARLAVLDLRTAAADADDLDAGARGQAGGRSRTSTPPPTTSRCWRRPRAPPACPKVTMHFHRDVLAIADTFGAHLVQARPGRRLHRHPAAGVHLRPRRAAGLPAAGRRVARCCSRRPRRCELAEAVERHAATVLFTAPTAYRAMLRAGCERQLRTPAPGGLGRRAPAARRSGRSSAHATGVRLIDGIGGTEMLHVFISAADDDIRPGATGRAVPGYRAAVLDDDGEPVPDGTPGRLAVKGPTGCRYLADAAAGRLRAGRLERHRRHLRPRRRRLLLVPGPQRRHDRLLRLQHRRPRGGGRRSTSTPTSSSARSSGGPTPSAGRSCTPSSCCATGVAGDAAKAAELQDFVKRTIAPYKYPRVDRVRRRAAAHAHRQAAALPAAPSRRADSREPPREHPCGSRSSAAAPAASTSPP